MNFEKLSRTQLDWIIHKAALAPSPHNVQGWKFCYHGYTLDVVADANCRIMRELDPLEKEGAIALGAAIENIVLAAAVEGFSSHVTWLPDGDRAPVVASINFASMTDSSISPEDGELYAYMEERGMNRSRYKRTPIPRQQIKALREIAAQAGFELHLVTGREQIRKLARLAGEAGRFKFSHAPTHRELFQYLRFTRKEAAVKRDGLPLEDFNIPPWLARFARFGMEWWAVRLLNIFGYHRLLAYMQETWLVNSAPAVCMLRAKDGNRISYLQGGRALQRIWLAAARYGLAVQPHSAIADLSYARLAGYDPSISPEWQRRIDTFPQRLRDIFSFQQNGEQDDLHVINIFRLGYATRARKRRSLRRPMNEHLEIIEPAETLEHNNAFYHQLIKRNGPFINGVEQQLLRRRNIGVAGCGSIGGASLEVLARMGAENFLLAEPDSFELNNLNRQNATLQDIGVHKAEAILRRIQQINPQVQGHILRQGLVPENIQYFVGSSAVIVDGVDVTEPSAIKAKIMLHEEAWRQQKTVICGYDIAGTQLLRIYDYGAGKLQPLHGKFTGADLDSVSPLGFLSKVVSPLDLPLEMLPVTRAMIDGTQDSIPQLGPTANLFGVLSAWAVLDVLAGRPVRHKVRVDIPGLLRPKHTVWKTFLIRLAGIVRLKLHLEKAMRQGRKSPAQMPDGVEQ